MTAVADSTGACLAQLRPAAFTDLSAGRVGVAARPGMRRISWLATDILTALGCSAEISGAGRPGDGDPRIAAAWLRVHRVRDLYVQFAWDISHPALAAAADLARQAGVHLWLVGDTPYSDNHAATLEPYNPRVWTETEFLTHWSAVLADPATGPHHQVVVDEPAAARANGAERAAVEPSGGQDPACGGSGWPARLPDDDFATFRSACRARLSPAQFELVDAAFRRARREAATSLVPLLAADPAPDRPPVEADSLEGSVAGWFAERWEETESVPHFLVTVRAAQVAAFAAGYFVQVDLDQLIGTATTSPRRAQRNPDTWARLRAYPQPYRAAACALAAAGMGVNDMVDLPVSAYDPDAGTVVDLQGRSFTVEPPARIFVEAQQTLRRLDGAADADLLFLNPVDGRPLVARGLSHAVRLARRELGAAVALAAPDRTTLDPSRWQRRWGVSIQELT